MTALLELLGRVLAPALGAVWHTGGPAGLIALAGVAGAIGLVAAVAAASLRSGAVAASLRPAGPWRRAVEPADRAELIGQSDPDADGRPRPRAPGLALPAA